MSFRYYTNAISQASKAVASGVFITGMALIGFGFMIYLLPKFFATLASIVFCVTGAGCVLTAVKIFVAQRKFSKMENSKSQEYRENVTIHVKEHHED